MAYQGIFAAVVYLLYGGEYNRIIGDFLAIYGYVGFNLNYGGYIMEKLIKKSANDVCRIYQTEYGFELRFNLLVYGDPVYTYTTLKGAKIAMAKMQHGIYKGLEPSMPWE